MRVGVLNKKVLRLIEIFVKAVNDYCAEAFSAAPAVIGFFKSVMDADCQGLRFEQGVLIFALGGVNFWMQKVFANS